MIKTKDPYNKRKEEIRLTLLIMPIAVSLDWLDFSLFENNNLRIIINYSNYNNSTNYSFLEYLGHIRKKGSPFFVFSLHIVFLQNELLVLLQFKK